MLTPWKESYDQPRRHIQKQRHYFANKGPSSQGYGFSCGHVALLGWSNLLTQVESEGASWYNGLEASVTKRLSKGLQFLASYTWSKTLDTDGANVVGSAAGGVSPGDQYQPGLRYGPSAFQRAQRFVFSYVYELPHPASQNRLFGKFLG